MAEEGDSGQKRHLVDQDPDYEDVAAQETKRQKLIEQDGKNHSYYINRNNQCSVTELLNETARNMLDQFCKLQRTCKGIKINRAFSMSLSTYQRMRIYVIFFSETNCNQEDRDNRQAAIFSGTERQRARSSAD